MSNRSVGIRRCAAPCPHRDQPEAASPCTVARTVLVAGTDRVLEAVVGRVLAGFHQLAGCVTVADLAQRTLVIRVTSLCVRLAHTRSHGASVAEVLAG